ncbi:hypothetical protein FQN53_006908 [Emmonsiellopsis sp. PD_33]|nr:hypothetical protein FQN53_006908 [Emmonsiellopsis sp. PD_33]KAK2804984.1 hypothetical protein FQN51_001078 [Onygenales sp. PD_10]
MEISSDQSDSLLSLSSSTPQNSLNDDNLPSHPPNQSPHQPGTGQNGQPTLQVPSNAHMLRRFAIRSLLLVVIPPLVTIYYFFIWKVLVSEDPERLPVGHRNAIWVYYSWFIVGVFGLNVSRYGLAGVEAAMLQHEFWHAKNAMVLTMHSGHSWSGLGGWARCLKRLFARKHIVGRLWYLLATLSLMATVALPLSGLSFELFDGYVKSSDIPNVIGYNASDFNRRPPQRLGERLGGVWQVGSPTVFPAAGVAFTAPYLDRSQYSYLGKLPNSLPDDGESVPDLFLVPQARYPSGGEAWGLRISYNCSLVDSVSNFTILSQRDMFTYAGRAGYDPYGMGYQDFHRTLSTSDPSKITAFNATASNIFGFGAVGSNTDDNAWYSGGEGFEYTAGGGGNASILEYALWQFHRDIAGDVDFNNTVSPSISGMGYPIYKTEDGSFAHNSSFWEGAAHLFNTTLYLGHVRAVAPPIGVRCARVSTLGTAKLDLDTFTFHSFAPGPPPEFGTIEINTVVFGTSVLRMLPTTNLDRIFESANAPQPLGAGNLQYYQNFLRPDMLLRSIVRAHAFDAMALMYDNVNTLANAYPQPNMTTMRPGKIIGLGVVPPLVPGVFFCIWAFGCCVLGVLYGFSPRWAETLDAFSFLRFGADYADDICDPQEFGSTVEFDKSDGLCRIPGLVGDSRVKREVGHITLVPRGNIASKRKKYM